MGSPSRPPPADAAKVTTSAGGGLLYPSAAMATRILIIEDDERLSTMVSQYLGEAGFQVSVRPEGGQGLSLLEREPFDALVLDLMLPDIDGFEVCRRVRAGSDLPILMLTARGDATDRVV